MNESSSFPKDNALGDKEVLPKESIIIDKSAV